MNGMNRNREANLSAIKGVAEARSLLEELDLPEDQKSKMFESLNRAIDGLYMQNKMISMIECYERSNESVNIRRIVSSMLIGNL